MRRLLHPAGLGTPSPPVHVAPGTVGRPAGPVGNPGDGRRHPSGRDRRRHRRWCWSLRLALGLVAALAVVAVTGTAFELSLPGVADARARVAAIDRSHGGVMAGPPLPAKLAASVVAVEDEHFYSNVFVNVTEGAGRAAWAALRRSGDPGGSTIEQQLAKQVYPHGPGLAGTLDEIGLGVKLALAYSKPQILAMYLDAVYFGNGYWGDVAAARGYFGVSPDHLTWAEASLLAGLPQAPSAYDPLHHLALARARQGHVLAQLVANRVLTRSQANAAYREPLPLRGG